MDQINKAIDVLKQGGIVVFPTDTAFGVGCRIDDENAVKRLFAIRKRPETQATPVLVDTVKMAQDYLEPIPKEVIDRLIEPYWPGALTIILYCIKASVPDLVRGGGDTLGVRIPNHKVARAIIRGLGIPVLGPSANFHGEKTPYAFDELDKEFIKQVDFLVNGECTVKQASTVIDCSVKPWKIVRQGAVLPVILNLFQDPINEMPKRVRHDKIVLYIDTSDNTVIEIGIEMNGKKGVIREAMDYRKSQVVLPLIEKLLKKHKLQLKDLTEIQVVTGPGSFTGIRVGVAIANTLGWVLKIPINGKKQNVNPTYNSILP